MALVAALALAATGAGISYLALASGGTPLAGTSAGLTQDCTYDRTRGAVVAPVLLRSVNDGEVVYTVTVDVTREDSGEVAASERVEVPTPDGQRRTTLEVVIPLEEARWTDDGYQQCMLSIDF